MEDKVEALTLRMLALRQPVAFDLRAILGALKIAHNLERMGDYAKNMAKRASALAQLQAVGPVNGISRMGRMTHAIIQEVLDAYAEQIGRASGRERDCPSVSVPGVDVA